MKTKRRIPQVKNGLTTCCRAEAKLLADTDEPGWYCTQCKREVIYVEVKYATFIRSARNFEEFARARKRWVDRGLSADEARRACAQFNDNRTAAQIRRGTKMEFTSTY